MSVQAVVTELPPLPALPAVFGASANVIALPLVTFTVRDSVRLAVRVTVPALEFIWALETGANPVAMKSRAIVARQVF